MSGRRSDRKPARQGALALVLCASLAAPVGWSAPAWAVAAGVSLRIGQARDLTHIEFSTPPAAVRKMGSGLAISFKGPFSGPDLARLTADPPRYLKPASIRTEGGGTVLTLEPAEGAALRTGQADGAVFVNAAAAPDAAPAPAGKDQLPTARAANPVPASGIVRMQPELQGRTLRLHFPWRAPLGAAVYRRGESLWMVFDAKASIDVSGAPHGLPQLRKVEAAPGAGYAAVRITLPSATLVSASAEGGTWTLALGPSLPAAAADVPIKRDDGQGSAALSATVAGATGVFWLADPEVGDRVAVVTALAPSKGLAVQHDFVDARLLPSAQGLAVAAVVDDLQVTTDGDLVRIGRPRGLQLSPAVLQARRLEVSAAADAPLPQPAAMPALVDFEAWSKTGAGGFVARYDQLMAAAADEAGRGKGAGLAARLGFARFLIGSDLAFEGIGVLNMAAKADQSLLGDPAFRGLRGAARAMTGRYKDAEADLSSPVLAEEPSAALWRGYVAEHVGDQAGARTQFAAGRTAVQAFAPKWRARFALAEAETALAVGDLGSAREAVLMADAQRPAGDDAMALKLAQARLLEAQHQPDQALGLYAQAATSPYGAVATPAELHAIQIKLVEGHMAANDAEAALESLRFRWRGDATELETVRALGRLYLGQGRYREALEALRSGRGLTADLPAAAEVSADAASAFKALFLDGLADGLQPIQSLALFYDFKDLTPIGSDGDMMVRRLSKRLVDVDLLSQASELLKYQVDNRLDGVARAEVSTDLAVIDLMDRRPEDALAALNGSRSTLLPTALSARRRVVEARAQLGLGRTDAALELIEGDHGSDAQDLRAEIAWKGRRWAEAASLLEAGLGDRWKTPAPLQPDEQGKLLRAATAFSLAGDDAALTRLRTRYTKLSYAVAQPDAMRVALTGMDGARLAPGDFARASASDAVFSGWVAAMKRRFAEAAAKPGMLRKA